MKTYISLLCNHSLEEQIAVSVNNILQQPISKNVFVYDLTREGFSKDLQKFLRGYSKYGVFVLRPSASRKVPDQVVRYNIGIGESIRNFIGRKSQFDKFVCMDPCIEFQNFDLQLFAEQVDLYNALSPIIESLLGVEYFQTHLDRWGREDYLPDDPSLYITGNIEETFSLNPKCFGFSRRFAERLRDFEVTSEPSLDYLNYLVNHSGYQMPKIDTSMFVHENLY